MVITIGIVAAAFVLLFAVTAVAENASAIGDWLFDVGTAYYKFKMQRRRKKWKTSM